MFRGNKRRNWGLIIYLHEFTKRFPFDQTQNHKWYQDYIALFQGKGLKCHVKIGLKNKAN